MLTDIVSEMACWISCTVRKYRYPFLDFLSWLSFIFFYGDKKAILWILLPLGKDTKRITPSPLPFCAEFTVTFFCNVKGELLR